MQDTVARPPKMETATSPGDGNGIPKIPTPQQEQVCSLISVGEGLKV